jgi:hypothetical protein
MLSPRAVALALGTAVCVVALIAAPSFRQAPLVARGPIPASLSDAEFWRLSETFSETGGTFHSDNFVSNEGQFQSVVPELVRRVASGGVYLGVGPEQNFTYITGVRPRIAFIVDIRRGNLHEHLLYKALFELSADRAEFLSRLFSRARPAGLSAATPVADLFAAYDRVLSTEALYQANLTAVLDLLTKTHGFKLHVEDAKGIGYVYRNAFFAEGPDLGYRLTGTTARVGAVTYADLMTMTDPAGRQRGYLATEENFAWLKALESKNMLVPVVGNFGGAKALRAVGRWTREHGAVVTTFYLSNVEQYLRQDGIWTAFCKNVQTFPLDKSSTFIRSVRGNGGRFGMGGGVGMFSSSVGEMMVETKTCNGGS